jgi:hypothetical protein
LEPKIRIRIKVTSKIRIRNKVTSRIRIRNYDYLEGVSFRLEELLGLGQVLELVRSLRLPLLQEVLEPLLTPATMIYLRNT